jgi:hypothetical protein
MPTSRKSGRAAGLRPEYDFSRGIRGKYVQRVAAGTNVVVLAPDVAAAFGSSKAVNEALRRQLRGKTLKRNRK